MRQLVADVEGVTNPLNCKMSLLFKGYNAHR